MTVVRFPPSFVWGVATSAYQIEGASGGRGASIWDTFAKQEGAILDGSNGDVACDHVRHYREDVRLMADIGVRAYRFSISWPRVLPDGAGVVNDAGLDFYTRLVDALLDVDAEPYVTLYHWELPATLEARGGWPERDTAHRFAEFSAVVERRLGDRVRHWMTHNEPWCQSVLGYRRGIHAPGRQDFGASLRAAHHLLLSHGLVARLLRETGSEERSVGIALNLVPATPASPSEADGEACRHFDGAFNRWFLDPLHGRGYPEDVIRDYQSDGRLEQGPLPYVRAGDMDVIAEPIDFLGVNYYMREVVRSEAVTEQENAPRTEFVAPPDEHTDMGWEVYPRGLHDILVRVHRDYGPRSLLITENGAAYDDGPDERGEITDVRRETFLREHLAAAGQAISEGVPLDGYFLWSLMDNYEWERGYEKRFGITWVDYDTLERTLKQSGRFYADVVKNGGFEAVDRPADAG